LRQRQSFSRVLLSQKSKTSRITSPCVLLLAQVTETMLKVLTCRNVDGELLLQFFPSVRCGSSSHIPLLAASSVLLFMFVVGVPTLMITFYKKYALFAVCVEYERR
jgi:hypothetical protein